MKKLLSAALAAIIAFAASSAECMAQEYPANEIALSYSMGTVPETAMIFGTVMGSFFSLGAWEVDDIVIPGALSIEYFHGMNKTFSIGCLATVDAMFGNSYLTIDDVREKDGTFRSTFVSVMPAVKAAWFRHPKFSMYSKMAVGPTVCIMPEDDLKDLEASLGWCFHIAPVGMEFGGGDWRAFLEAGWGVQGFLNIGVKRCF